MAVQTKGVGAWLASSMKLDVRHDRHKPSFSFSLYVANFHVASKTQATSKMRARCSFSVQARSPSVYFRISLDGPNIGGGAMIDPTAKALRLLTVSEASSRTVARSEMHKVADFIHCWLYGMEPAPSCAPKMGRVQQDSDRGHLLKKAFLN